MTRPLERLNERHRGAAIRRECLAGAAA
jgi:hypothetical protein